MKRPFGILLYIIFLVSVIISLFSKISFYVFLKRSIIYLVFITIGIKIFESTIKASKNRKSDDDEKGSEKKEDHQKPVEDDDFKPLDFQKMNQTVDENIRIKNSPGGLAGDD